MAKYILILFIFFLNINFSSGAIQVYTDENLFTNKIDSTYYREQFWGWLFNSPPDIPPYPEPGNHLNRTQTTNNYQWTAYSSSYIFSVDDGLSIADGGDGTGILYLYLNNLTASSNMTAFGCQFIAVDFAGIPALVDYSGNSVPFGTYFISATNSISVTVTYGAGSTKTIKITDCNFTAFRGFICDSYISQIEIQYIGYIPIGESRFPGVMNMYLGKSLLMTTNNNGYFPWGW